MSSFTIGVSLPGAGFLGAYGSNMYTQEPTGDSTTCALSLSLVSTARGIRGTRLAIARRHCEPGCKHHVRKCMLLRHITFH